jgi:hypothetical protein
MRFPNHLVFEYFVRNKVIAPRPQRGRAGSVGGVARPARHRNIFRYLGKLHTPLFAMTRGKGLPGVAQRLAG